MTTSIGSMKEFSENYTMRAPGSDLWVKSQQETARILSDGMEAGRILIPTHNEGWETIRERAADPDAFLAKKNAEYLSGDPGKPGITQDVIDSIRD